MQVTLVSSESYESSKNFFFVQTCNYVFQEYVCGSLSIIDTLKPLKSVTLSP